MESFEERLKRLEDINDEINAGELPLASAVDKFEEGIKLAQGLEKELAKIERKVEILGSQPDSEDENPNLELFPDLDTEPAADSD